MTLSVNISGLDQITEALNNLARALGSHGATVSVKDMTAGTQTMPQQAPQTGLPVGMAGMPGGLQGSAASLPTQAPASALQPGWPGSVAQTNSPAPGAAGTPGLTPPAGPLPTTASPQAYTQDQIAVAMTGLVDQGKQPQVMQVLAQFGAASLMQVPKEQYPALAAQLRALGAAI